MPPRLNDGLAESARSVLEAWWTLEPERLEDAQTELSVCFELFQADLHTKPLWYRSRYEEASPRRRFQTFLTAMKLPEGGSSTESVLTGLTFAELELVWLGIHVDYMEGAMQTPGLIEFVPVHARQVQMTLLHLRTRALCSTQLGAVPHAQG